MCTHAYRRVKHHGVNARHREGEVGVQVGVDAALLHGGGLEQVEAGLHHVELYQSPLAGYSCWQRSHFLREKLKKRERLTHSSHIQKTLTNVKGKGKKEGIFEL